ncbi:hypothetical protein ELI02_25640 (plasmid) [Rhizobium leguminosarum]|uniref:Integral membrane protein n=1 Tax=Rhizobium leguminosarum TaxID=384 RepID=A0A4Q8XSF4_RHILE|nr:hypothetical protein [Rhizobium leguminosarum]TAV44005.1 hypothetical protein ELI31_28825 [Rhizobium leguminosarum]TAV44438.1 hypothetical protein ELI32_30170 [Rhizobium leguminosarum]TAV62814.1 hypothetical protein ELI30_29905 [Rhizobium leguminosarum]TAX47413.1 hypothetical protein ELI02_25640 [Rhizobium leguminosarum]TAX47894.1 hypothetical protein ELI01_27120 [Rhizobium leguminosarum]
MMNILTVALKEFFGMFIDDGALALAALLLAAIVGVLVKFAHVDALLAAALLLLGCLLILAESLTRAARRRFQRK